MNREYSFEDFMELYDFMVKVVPNITIATDISKSKLFEFNVLFSLWIP